MRSKTLMIHVHISLILFVLLQNYAVAEDTPYRKKNVSFVDRVVVSSNVKSPFTMEQLKLISEKIRESITDKRFDYVAFPLTMYASFQKALEDRMQASETDLVEIINSTLSVTLMGILDQNKELIAKQYVSDEDRNRFLALKAKVLGMNATDFEAVLNSGCFYIPYVRLECEKRHGYYDTKFDLRLLWYQINVGRDNRPSVSLIGIAKGFPDRPSYGGWYDAKTGFSEFDLERLLDEGCKELMYETRKLDLFKLNAIIEDVSFNGVSFKVGQREGVQLNDLYKVFEMEENENGIREKKEIGLVKITQNEGYSSYGQIVFGGGFGVGQEVDEFPMLGIDLKISAVALPYHLGKYNNLSDGFFGSGSGNNFGIDIKSNSPSYGFQGNVDFDISNVVGISDLWAQVGGGWVFSDIDGKMAIRRNQAKTVYDTVNMGYMWSLLINGGMSEKFYYRRIGLVAGIGGNFYLTSTESARQVGGERPIDTSFTLTSSNVSVYGEMGVEVYLTPKLLLNASALYHKTIPHSTWRVIVSRNDPNNSDDKKRITNIENKFVDGPNLAMNGLEYKVTLVIALPSYKNRDVWSIIANIIFPWNWL